MDNELDGDPAYWRQLWAARDTHTSRVAIYELCDRVTLHAAAERLGTEFRHLNEFLRPRIDPAKLRASRGDRQATVDLMWAYRTAGWSAADIARAVGLSRQRVGVLLKTPPRDTPLVESKPPTPRRRSPAPKYRQLRTLPDYELVELDELASKYHAAPSPQTYELLAATAHRLHTTFRVRLDHISSRCRVPLPEHRVSDAAA